MTAKHPLLRLIYVILIGLVLNSCSSYRLIRVNNDQKLDYDGKIIHLIWDSDTNNNFYLKLASVQDDSLKGYLYTRQGVKLSNEVKRRVDIHLNSSVPKPTVYPADYAIAASGIKSVEVYEYDAILGAVRTVLVVAGVAVVAAAVLVLIIALTKESCPFIYAWNGNEFAMTGEIYSGAIFPSLERDDYLPLPDLQPKDGQYQLRIANEMKEIQSTNLTELLVVDHPRGSHVLLDKHGNCVTYGKLFPPEAASSTLQTDILPQLLSADSLIYAGDFQADSTQGKDEIYLTFNRPSGADHANLVLKAKNSLWLDYTMKRFFEQFGDRYQAWYKKQQKEQNAMQRNWSQDQGVTLSVYLKVNGQWEIVDFFDVVGPMAEREIIMPLDLAQLDSDQIQLKLSCGALFWEIDRVGLDFTLPMQVRKQTVSLQLATDDKDRNVTTLLTKNDEKYYVMPEVGNHALLQFAIPPAGQNCCRTVFLHSRGYYEVLRETSGTPDITYLKTFLEPGRMGLFSREKFIEASQRLN